MRDPALVSRVKTAILNRHIDARSALHEDWGDRVSEVTVVLNGRARVPRLRFDPQGATNHVRESSSRASKHSINIDPARTAWRYAVLFDEVPFDREMVAAARLRRAEQRIEVLRPYADALRRMT